MDKKTKDDKPYNIKIDLIKVRDLIFKKKDRDTTITRYLLMPLFEKPIPRAKEIVKNDEIYCSNKIYSEE